MVLTFMVRSPAVSGRFYPAVADQLRDMIRGFVDAADQRTSVLGALVPHAGYVYSGHVAGAVYSAIDVPSRSVVLCPNHTGYGPPLSIMRSGSWRTPLGEVAIDEEMGDSLMALDPSLENDAQAHRFEHAIEVQLPFLQYVTRTSFRFVPIAIGLDAWTHLEALGLAIAEVIRRIDPKTLIVASSDMNHYESDGTTRVKDRKAIDQILALNPRGLHETIHRERVSMCGYGPAVAMLVAAKSLGASKAELVKYATSGDVSGDFDHVVGYAGMTVF